MNSSPKAHFTPFSFLIFLVALIWHPVQAQTDSQESSTLLRINQRGDQLVVGVPYDLPPYSYLDGSGQLVGFDVDLLRLVAAEWDVQVEFVPVNPTDLLSLLAAGTIDVGPFNWMEIDADIVSRVSANIEFSQPYFVDGWCILQYNAGLETEAVGRSRQSGTSPAQEIGYASVGADIEAHLIAWFAAENVPLRVTEGHSSLFSFREHGNGVSALKAEQIRGFATLAQSCRSYAGHEALTVRLAGEKSKMGNIFKIWGISGREQALRHLINHTLQVLVRNGQYVQLSRRWFPEQPPFQVDLTPDVWTKSYRNLVGERQEISQPQQLAFTGGVQFDELRIGVPYDLPPFGFLSTTQRPASGKQNETANTANQRSQTQDELVGLSVDLARALAQQMGDAGTNVTLIPVTHHTSVPMLVKNELDLVVGMLSSSWERAAEVDFSEPYLHDRAALLVHVESGIRSRMDLAGKTIAYVEGDIAADLWAAEFRRLAESPENLAPGGYLPFQEYMTAFRSLEMGQVDVLIGGQQLLTYAAKDSQNLILADSIASPINYSIGVAAGRSDLRLALNGALHTLAYEGYLAELASRWLKKISPKVEATPVPVRTPRRSGEAEKLRFELLNPQAATARARNLVNTEPESREQTSRTHTVAPGESLITLALRYYSDQSKWQLLYEANRALIGPDPNRIEAGINLTLPEIP